MRGLVKFGTVFAYVLLLLATQMFMVAKDSRLLNSHAQLEGALETIDVTGPGNYFVPYKGDPIMDVWGNPIDITYTATSYTNTVFVCSAGPDQEMGTEDDIVYGRMYTLTDMIPLTLAWAN